jgi:hypothetical protein
VGYTKSQALFPGPNTCRRVEENLPSFFFVSPIEFLFCSGDCHQLERKDHFHENSLSGIVQSSLSPKQFVGCEKEGKSKEKRKIYMAKLN